MGYTTKFLMVLVFSFSLIGCDVQTKDVQLIEVKVFSDDEKNDKVAQALMYYSPAYFQHNIPSITIENGSAIQPGYVRSLEKNKSYFRVFYVMSNDKLKLSTIKKIKKEFERHIPKMSQEHASAWELQGKESALKSQWLKEFLNSQNAERFRDDLSKLLPADYQDYFLNTPQKVQEKLGLVKNTIYLRYQYYKPFGEFKEQLILNYKVVFDSGLTAAVNISLDKNQSVSLIEVLPLKS